MILPDHEPAPGAREKPPNGRRRPDDAATQASGRALVALSDGAEGVAVARDLEARGVAATAARAHEALIPGGSVVGVVLVDEDFLGRDVEATFAALERAHGPETRVVVAARSPLALAQRARERVLVLLRPLDPETLRSVMRAALDAHARALEVRELVNELDRALRSRDDFLSILSHELRTPLTPILGWTQILKRGVTDPEKIRTGLDVIERNARQQAAIVNDLLDLSRAQHGTLELDMGTVELRELVLQQVLTYTDLARKSDQTIDTTAVVEGEPLLVRADPERLNQVLGHLLGNALKFTPRGGAITVKVAEKGEDALIEVADTGAGFAPSLIEELFRVFWQADSGIKRRKGGLGVGLALARLLIEAHGGSIAATSAGPGRGATFTVTLPRTQAVPSPPALVGPASLIEDVGGGRHLLVVEDDDDTRAALGELLERAGFDVTVAANGREGLARAEATEPLLVLTDIAMPVMDGYELARALQDHPTLAGTPVVALSGQGQRLDPQTARRLGFTDYLLKPTSPVALLGALRRAVSGHGRRKSAAERA